MNAKSKATELVGKYYNYVSAWTQTSKPTENPTAQYEGYEMKRGRAIQCSILAVNEVIDKDGYNNEFWQDVKKELELLK